MNPVGTPLERVRQHVNRAEGHTGWVGNRSERVKPAAVRVGCGVERVCLHQEPVEASLERVGMLLDGIQACFGPL